VEVFGGVRRDAGGSRRRGYGRWIANLQSEFPRRFTSLWIGTTTKVRVAVVPLSSGCWSVRDTLCCKHTQGVRKVETETFAALTASGHSPGRRRSRAQVRPRPLTEPTTTVLRSRKERTGSSGNVWRNWGYLAELRQGWANRWRQQMGRLRSEKKNLAPQVGFEPTTLRLTAECSTVELLRSNRWVLPITAKATTTVNFRRALRRYFTVGYWIPNCSR
jgi:hypothetical protein